jgi:hypothetical protein
MNNIEIKVQFLAGAKNFLISKTSELTLGISPASCSVGFGGSFPRGNVAGDNLTLTFTAFLYVLFYLFTLWRCTLLFWLGICRGHVCEMLLQYYGNLTSTI